MGDVILYLCGVFIAAMPQAPPVIKPVALEKSQLVIPVGEPIQLKFQVEAYPPPNVRWYHDGAPIQESTEVEVRYSPHPFIQRGTQEFFKGGVLADKQKQMKKKSPHIWMEEADKGKKRSSYPDGTNCTSWQDKKKGPHIPDWTKSHIALLTFFLHRAKKGVFEHPSNTPLDKKGGVWTTYTTLWVHVCLHLWLLLYWIPLPRKFNVRVKIPPKLLQNCSSLFTVPLTTKS